MKRSFLSALVTAMTLCTVSVCAYSHDWSARLDQSLTQVRYSVTSALSVQEGNRTGHALLSDTDFEESAGDAQERPKLKSPFKAFLFSLVLPGAGQVYNSQPVKAVPFVGAEAAAWILYSSYQSDGDKLTDEFRAFNDEHWSADAYGDFLQWTYGPRDDDSINVTEFSHNLPSTKTQQYYEMTGKYNQFAWGWDDARHNGRGLEGVAPPDSNPYTSSDPPDSLRYSVPTTARRLQYEVMRDNANRRYDNASKMIIVSMVNHLASAFEALIAARNKNKKLTPVENLFGDIKVRASLRSVYSRRDTPYVTLTYKFK